MPPHLRAAAQKIIADLPPNQREAMAVLSCVLATVCRAAGMDEDDAVGLVAAGFLMMRDAKP